MPSGSLRRVLACATVACLLILVILSVLPRDMMMRTGAPKILEHFAAYGGTAFLAGLGPLRRASRPVSLALFIVLAGVLEYAQNWSPGRDAGWDTFLASTAGALCGFAFAHIAIRLLGRLRLRKPAGGGHDQRPAEDRVRAAQAKLEAAK